MQTLYLLATAENIEKLPSDALILPTGISVAMALRDRKVRVLQLSDYVDAFDFHSVWKDTISEVWRAIEECSQQNTKDPQPIAIFGYHIALALAQMLVLGRWFDRAHAALCFDQIFAESVEDGGGGESIYATGVTNILYAQCAEAWAHGKGVAYSEKKVASAPDPHGQPSQRKVRLRVRLGALPVRYLNIARAVVRRARIVLFSDNFGPLPALSKRWRTQTELVVLREGKRNKNRPLEGQRAFDELRASGKMRGICRLAEPFDTILLSRLANRMRVQWHSGMRAYREMTRVARGLRRLGSSPVLLANAPFNDSDSYPIGFAAEAFRSAGGKVIEYQHGGNYTLLERGFTPTILTSGLANLFLEWNGAGSREHEVYGLKSDCLRFARVGAPDFFSPQANHQRREQPIRLAYGVAMLSTVTLSGIGLPWDDYLAFLDESLPLLDSSTQLHVDVSYLPVPEMELFLSRRSYKKIVFHKQSFRRIAAVGDILMADLFVSSPPYEALTTQKPAIILTGSEFYRIDPEFLRDVERRCVCYANLTSYLEGIRELTADPSAYLASNVRSIDSAFKEKYFPRVQEDKFWREIDNVAAGVRSTCSSLALN